MLSQFLLYVVLPASFIYYLYLLTNADPVPREWKRVLLVIAHPDDECMFFGPTLVGLLGAEVARNGGKLDERTVKVLCLSTGSL